MCVMQSQIVYNHDSSLGCSQCGVNVRDVQCLSQRTKQLCLSLVFSLLAKALQHASLRVKLILQAEVLALPGNLVVALSIKELQEEPVHE